MNTAVTLILSLQPSTCSSCQHAEMTEKFILEPCLSQCFLCLSVCSLIWETLRDLSRAVQPKPLCSLASDPACGGVDCLCADDFKCLQSSLETLQPPLEATILHCRAWTIPHPLLVTKRKSSQGRDKWVLLIPWDSLKVRHRPVLQQPKWFCLERTKGEPKVWAWAFFPYRAASAQLFPTTSETCLLLV